MRAAAATYAARGLRVAQALRVDVHDQRGQKDKTADQDFKEAVDLDVVEAVVQHAEHEDVTGHGALEIEVAGKKRQVTLDQLIGRHGVVVVHHEGEALFQSRYLAAQDLQLTTQKLHATRELSE